jgi:hypothetical protein
VVAHRTRTIRTPVGVIEHPVAIAIRGWAAMAGEPGHIGAAIALVVDAVAIAVPGPGSATTDYECR